MASHRELPPIPYQALLRGALIGHRPECYSFDNNCHCSSRQHYRPGGSQENFMTRMSSEEVIRNYSSLPTTPTLPTGNVAKGTGVHGAPYGHGAHTMYSHTTVPNGSLPPYTQSGHGTTITHHQPPHMRPNGAIGQVQYGYPNRPSAPVAGNMQEAIAKPTMQYGPGRPTAIVPGVTMHPTTNQNQQQHGPSEVAKQQQQQQQQQKAAMTVTQPTVTQAVMNMQQPPVMRQATIPNDVYGRPPTSPTAHDSKHQQQVVMNQQNGHMITPHAQQQANIMRQLMQSRESRPTLPQAGGLTVQQADMIRASQDQAAMIRAKQNQAAMMMQGKQNQADMLQGKQNQADMIRTSQDQAAMIRAKQNQAAMMMQGKQNQTDMIRTSQDQAAMMMQAKQNQADMIRTSQDQAAMIRAKQNQAAMMMQAKQNQEAMIRASQDQAAMMQAEQNQAAMMMQAKQNQEAMIRAKQNQAAMMQAEQNQAAMMMQAKQNQADMIKAMQQKEAMKHLLQNRQYTPTNVNQK
ncbi:hypothetical protein Pcinc_030242 [Petrolisthes cinctipes]|uniref:Uncharacterized protein n=1 Tax=Petrolisthes cinctipes TaxID=88211 RepID=A0AAE1K4I5_PETCI|nr:hypothetical protein Pcinc_030242 [Petrolisthes cinctipes]